MLNLAIWHRQVVVTILFYRAMHRKFSSFVIVQDCHAYFLEIQVLSLILVLKRKSTKVFKKKLLLSIFQSFLLPAVIKFN